MNDFKLVDRMHSRLCSQCLHDLDFRKSEGNGCNILLEAILLQGLPEEWQGGLCDSFEPEP